MSAYVDRSQSHEDEFTVNITVTKKRRDETRRGYDDSATPPSYESVRPDAAGMSSRRTSGGRNEWDNVAARIATRTTSARNAAKRLSNNYSSTRIEKSSPRRHKAVGLSIDTSVTKPRASPKQVFPKQSRRQQAYTKLADEQDRAENAPPPSYHSTQRQQVLPEAQLVSKFSPETPTILITPALSSRVSSEPRARVASSVYSRMTSGATPPTQAGDVPPLPQSLPALLKKSQPLIANQHPATINLLPDQKQYRESSGTTFEEDLDEKKMARIMSNATEFEEDQLPRSPGMRTGQSRNDATIDSAVIPTPHRSKGWWNVITTPFQAGAKFVRSPTDGERTPDVPAVPAAYYAQQGPQGGLGLDIRPRNTHNSQALRRLESKDHLKAEPFPPLPRERQSVFSTFSPNEREVPLMLHVSPIDKDATGRAPKSEKMNSEQNLKLPFQPNGTPESARTEFSPVGQVINEGHVFAAKGVVLNPRPLEGSTLAFNQGTFQPTMQHADTSSVRSSLTAEVLKASPQPPMAAFPLENVQLKSRSVPYFAPPPTYPYQSSQDPGRYDPPVRPQGPFPPTRFSSYDALSRKESKRGKLCGLLKRKKKSTKSEETTMKKKKKRRRWCFWLCCILILFFIILGIVLGLLLGRKKTSSSSSQQWFNITNFPPIPGGVLTVVRPNLRTSVSGCVNPQTIWSCAVPSEQQASIKPNDPDQPNFLFDIRMANSSASPAKFRRSNADATQAWNPLKRDTPVLQPSPKPPTIDDYKFLGNTTDGIIAPFEGEATPFYISFNPPSQANFRRSKRNSDPVVEAAAGSAASSTTAGSAGTTSAATTTTTVTDTSSTSVITVPNIQTIFPKPQINSDGTAQAANLLPFPSFQPLRLFNRGMPDEHYGFYTYFDRSIFLRSVTFQNSSEQAAGDIPADANGGSAEDAATSRCTWTDTRFKVQIFTNKNASAAVLSPPQSQAAPKPGSTTLVRPGTFPYPVTITLDRHGGGPSTKMLFCYGMNDREIINVNQRKIQPEDRAFGGTIVNPSQPFVDTPVTIADGGPGGIDGGSGGCMCEWANWMST